VVLEVERDSDPAAADQDPGPVETAPSAILPACGFYIRKGSLR
jgi:hypothetical protein